jgi:hypothetical protein
LVVRRYAMCFAGAVRGHYLVERYLLVEYLENAHARTSRPSSSIQRWASSISNTGQHRSSASSGASLWIASGCRATNDRRSARVSGGLPCKLVCGADRIRSPFRVVGAACREAASLLCITFQKKLYGVRADIRCDVVFPRDESDRVLSAGAHELARSTSSGRLSRWPEPTPIALKRSTSVFEKARQPKTRRAVGILPSASRRRIYWALTPSCWAASEILKSPLSSIEDKDTEAL